MPHFEKGIEVKEPEERFAEAAKASGLAFQDLADSINIFGKAVKEAQDSIGHFEKGRWNVGV